MEGKIEMAARRLVTNKLRDAYRKASQRDKARILDEVMATTGMGPLDREADSVRLGGVDIPTLPH